MKVLQEKKVNAVNMKLIKLGKVQQRNQKIIKWKKWFFKSENQWIRNKKVIKQKNSVIQKNEQNG